MCRVKVPLSMRVKISLLLARTEIRCYIIKTKYIYGDSICITNSGLHCVFCVPLTDTFHCRKWGMKQVKIRAQLYFLELLFINLALQ